MTGCVSTRVVFYVAMSVVATPSVCRTLLPGQLHPVAVGWGRDC